MCNKADDKEGEKLNSETFYQEVKNSYLCPENVDEIFKEFRSYQQLTIETLVEIHRICEKYGIQYQLAFGTLLGVVRDNGLIPWDYDIDIVIPYSERYKLIRALKEDLSERFYFCCPEINEDCRPYHMRVTPKGYKSDKLHVDIFYLIGAPEDKNERTHFEEEMLKYYKLREYKLVKLRDYKSIRIKLSYIYHKLLSLYYSLNDINKYLADICDKYDPFKTNVSIVVLSVNGYLHLAWPTKELWDTFLIDTKMGTFRITKNYDTVLKSIYKDYKKIYPLEKRLGEMLNCYSKISENNMIKNYNMKKRYYLE